MIFTVRGRRARVPPTMAWHPLCLRGELDMFAKSWIRPVLLALGALSLSGCWAEVRSEPAYAEVDDMPADIEVYPHTVYEGETVYWVGDRWYYRRGPHWV